MSRTFELKLRGGRVVLWEGADGEAASVDYARSHPGAEVLAWRLPRARGSVLVWGGARILEPGDRGW